MRIKHSKIIAISLLPRNFRDIVLWGHYPLNIIYRRTKTIKVLGTCQSENGVASQYSTEIKSVSSKTVLHQVVLTV